jgi:hypothetical protein
LCQRREAAVRQARCRGDQVIQVNHIEGARKVDTRQRSGSRRSIHVVGAEKSAHGANDSTA